MCQPYSTTTARYAISLNHKLACRELIDRETGAVIAFADFTDAAGNVEITARCDTLNAQHEAAALVAPAVEPASCYHCDAPLQAGEREVCARCYVAPTVIPAAPLVTRAAVGQALKQARATAAADQAWTNAINKAAIELEAQPWQFDGQTLLIRSRSERALEHTTDGQTCSCKAFKQEPPKPCWHRAAHRLLIRATALQLAADCQASTARAYSPHTAPAPPPHWRRMSTTPPTSTPCCSDNIHHESISRGWP